MRYWVRVNTTSGSSRMVNFAVLTHAARLAVDNFDGPPEVWDYWENRWLSAIEIFAAAIMPERCNWRKWGF